MAEDAFEYVKKLSMNHLDYDEEVLKRIWTSINNNKIEQHLLACEMASNNSFQSI